MNIKKMALAGLLILFVTPAFAGGSGAPLPDYSVDGITGLAPVDSTTYFALHFDFSSEWALEGFLWYNNDGQVVLPTIYLTSGDPLGPGLMTEAFPVLEGLSGETLDWSQVSFESPVASSQDGLFVIFELDQTCEFIESGPGGGFGIGYRESESGSKGWYSSDGETWVGLDPGYRYAVQPNLVQVQPGMVLLSANRPGENQTLLEPFSDDNAPDNLVEEMIVAGPNPFNPTIKIWYHVPQEGGASMAIYDVRGRLVKKFDLGIKAAGNHFVSWHGKDSSGMQAASGVYLVMYKIEGKAHRRQITLLK